MTTYSINFSASTIIKGDDTANNYDELDDGTLVKTINDNINFIVNSRLSLDEVKERYEQQFLATLPYQYYNAETETKYECKVAVVDMPLDTDYELVQSQSSMKAEVIEDLVENEVQKEKQQEVFDKMQIELDNTINQIFVSKPRPDFTPTTPEEEAELKELEEEKEKIEQKRKELKQKLKDLGNDTTSFNDKVLKIQQKHKSIEEAQAKTEKMHKENETLQQKTDDVLKNTEQTIKDTEKQLNKTKHERKKTEKTNLDLTKSQQIQKQIEKVAEFTAKVAKTVGKSVTKLLSFLFKAGKSNSNNNNNDNDNSRGMR
jgi:hypothetical protein